MGEIFQYFFDLPYSVKGFCCENHDGTYTVILNSKMTFEQNLKSYMHELEHISNCDMNNYLLSIDSIEKSRHKE